MHKAIANQKVMNSNCIITLHGNARQHSTFFVSQLTSSYSGYGISSLDKDASEISLLTDTLYTAYGSTDIVLVGHSTGCQIIVRFMQRHHRVEGGLMTSLIRGAVLQAAVSDREYLVMEDRDSMDRMASEAQAMVVSGKGDEICFRCDLVSSKNTHPVF